MIRYYNWIIRLTFCKCIAIVTEIFVIATFVTGCAISGSINEVGVTLSVRNYTCDLKVYL